MQFRNEKKESYVEIKGSDSNGEFKIRIQRDCTQLQLETADDTAYIDICLSELKTIRDTMTKVINERENS